MKFVDVVREIEAEYAALGHQLGWRFLCVSKRVLKSNPQIAFITANPGGDRERSDHGVGSCENGSAYLSEQWGNALPGQGNLQRQVQLLFEVIGRKTRLSASNEALIESSLIGYFIPFRSPRLALLPRKAESLAFAKSLWRRIFVGITPKLVITIDPDAFKHVSMLFQERPGYSLEKHVVSATGWGDVSAETKWYSSPSGTISIIRLPHLSTFKLFSRAECQAHVDEIIARACGHF